MNLVSFIQGENPVTIEQMLFNPNTTDTNMGHFITCSLRNSRSVEGEGKYGSWGRMENTASVIYFNAMHGEHSVYSVGGTMEMGINDKRLMVAGGKTKINICLYVSDRLLREIYSTKAIPSIEGRELYANGLQKQLSAWKERVDVGKKFQNLTIEELDRGELDREARIVGLKQSVIDQVREHGDDQLLIHMIGMKALDNFKKRAEDSFELSPSLTDNADDIIKAIEATVAKGYWRYKAIIRREWVKKAIEAMKKVDYHKVEEKYYTRVRIIKSEVGAAKGLRGIPS